MQSHYMSLSHSGNHLVHILRMPYITKRNLHKSFMTPAICNKPSFQQSHCFKQPRIASVTPVTKQVTKGRTTSRSSMHLCGRSILYNEDSQLASSPMINNRKKHIFISFSYK